MAKNNFDFLRCFFAFIVLLAHIIDLSGSPTLSFLRPFFDAYISVTCFFIISGYLIAKSYINTYTLRQYVVKRAKRILPAYVLVVLLCAVSLATVSHLGISQYFSTPGVLKYIICNLFFLNFLQPCLPGVFGDNALCAVNGALWTIKVEVSFYLILPLVIMVVNKVKKKHMFFIGIYVASLLYKGLMLHQFKVTGNPLFSTLSNQLPAFLSYFVCGIAIHYYFDSYIKLSKVLFFLAMPLFFIEHYFGSELLKPLTLSFIVFYLAFNLKFLNNFGRYGDISYGLYIFHFPIIQLFVYYNYFKIYSPFLVSILIIVIVLACAFLSWTFVEKRFLVRHKSANLMPST